MRKVKILALLLLLAICLPVAVMATGTDADIGVSVSVTPEVTKFGEEVTVTVALDGYTAASEKIRGLQVDITGVDTQILSVVEYKTLIDDSTAASNKASYNANASRVRLAYVRFDNETLAPCADVLQAKFQVNSDLTEAGSITLPITVKIQTVSSQITLTSQCVIQYDSEGTPVTTLEISWGDMEFAYSDGVWNTETFQYDGAGWTDNGSGYVTVKNATADAAAVNFRYDTQREDIRGSFTDGTNAVSGTVNIPTGQEKTVYLTLAGKPSENLENIQIGKVTVEIGGE